jgi:predicted PurR-regulated permease PerM
MIIGLNYAFLLGFCAVFLTIIPYIGAFIICTSAVLLAFVQFGDVTHGLLPLAVFAVVQVIEGFVLQPKILGDKVGLHPLAIIIAVIAGTTLLGGLLGGILAIPVTAALRVILYRYVWVKKEE